jgi:GNAT superfamily N-acetyltransferase
VIRLRQDSDLPALVQILRDVHAADQYPAVWPDDPLEFVATASPMGAWVAELDGQPLGQVLLCTMEAGSDWGELPGRSNAELAEIKRLFVSPSAHGMGLAQQLLSVALAEATRRTLQAVLQTRADNAASNRFYERSGWQRAGTVQAPWTDTDGRHPQMRIYTAPGLNANFS